MKKVRTLSILILIMLVTTTSSFANGLNVLVLGQYQGHFETVMVDMYQSGSTENRIISIPPGAVFLDGDSYFRSGSVVQMLEESGIPPFQVALAQYLDLSLPYYLIVDYEGAQGVVDAMGGVYFDLPQAMELPGENGEPALQLEPGLQLFSGDIARRFLRYRTGDLHGPAELQVIELQQRFLDAMIRQLAQEKRKIIPVALKLPKMIKTNIGIFKLLDLAYDAIKMSPDDLKVMFGIIPGTFVMVENQYQYHVQGMQGYRLSE